MIWRFRGATTKRTYSFMVNPLTQGATTITIAGETCIPANNDGTVGRGILHGPIPPTDPYGFTILPSTWEQQ